jgi:hypothetical protein
MRVSAEIEHEKLKDDLERRIRNSADEVNARHRLAATFERLEAQYRAKLKEADEFWSVLEDHAPAKRRGALDGPHCDPAESER